MQQNYMNSYSNPYFQPQANPNAVSINIFTPQAYGTPSNGATCPIGNNNGFYSLYGQNMNPNLPLYPQNYNNLALQQNYYPNSNGVQTPYSQTASYPSTQQTQTQNPTNTQNSTMPIPTQQEIASQDMQNKNLSDLNQANMTNGSNLISKTENTETLSTTETKKEEKTKKIVPLTDEYIKSIENYMNSENPKVRLIGAKELLERFKEDENRKDNPSLMPLLNKALRDTSPSVRFLALTILQLEYALGNDETVTILKEIQSQNQDKLGQDQLLASEILLNMAAPSKVSVPMTQEEIEKADKKAKDKK